MSSVSRKGKTWPKELILCPQLCHVARGPEAISTHTHTHTLSLSLSLEAPTA